MAEEFTSFLADARKSPIEEKINSFGIIIEKIMTIILRIPDLVDDRISAIQAKINALTNDVSALKTRSMTSPSIPGAAPGSPPPPGGSPGGSPPPGGPPGGSPPPGGPPGGSPPPGGPPGGSPGGSPPPGPKAPSSPVSLRGAIMGELKQLFAKRRS